MSISPLVNPAITVPVVPPFDPLTDIAWGNFWRADSGVTLSGSPATDGGVVDSWNAVVNALAMTSSAGNRPIFRAADAAFNGKPCVEFDGSNDVVTTSGGPASNAQPNTIFFVYKMLSVAGAVIKAIGDSNSGSRHSLYVDATGFYRLYAGTLGSSSSIAADTNLHMGLGEVNGASSVIQIDGTTATGSWGTNNLSGFRLGASPPGATTPANVKIAAAGWFDGLLTTDQKNSLRAWCQSYYGTP